jgi:hypothetical protein
VNAVKAADPSCLLERQDITARIAETIARQTEISEAVLRATEGIVEIGRFGLAESVWKRTDSVWVPCKRAGAVERHRRGPLPRTPEALRYTLPAVSLQAFVSTTNRR